MPIRACAECGRPFKAPPHQPGTPRVTVCDRHAKPKTREKTETPGPDGAASPAGSGNQPE